MRITITILLLSISSYSYSKLIYPNGIIADNRNTESTDYTYFGVFDAAQTINISIAFSDAVTADDTVGIKIYEQLNKMHFIIKYLPIKSLTQSSENPLVYSFDLVLDNRFSTTGYYRISICEYCDDTFYFYLNSVTTGVQLATNTPDQPGQIKIYSLKGEIFADFWGYKAPENLPTGIYIYTFEAGKRYGSGKIFVP